MRADFGPCLSKHEVQTFARVRVVAIDGKSSRTALVSDVEYEDGHCDVEFVSSDAGGPSENAVALSRLRHLEDWEHGENAYTCDDKGEQKQCQYKVLVIVSTPFYTLISVCPARH